MFSLSKLYNLVFWSSRTTNSAIFSGFSGFGATDASAPTTSIFSFLNTNTTTIPDNTEKKPLSVESAKPINGNSKPKEYYQKLRALNEGFSSWVKQHVDKDPICILTPIFRDYEQHLKDIDTVKAEKGETSVKESNPEPFKSFSFASGNTNSKPNSTTASPTLSNLSSSQNVLSSASSFTSSIVGTASTGFSFGGSSSTAKPFTFGSAISQSFAKEEPKPAAENEDEDEPPKVEFTPVVEEDNVFSKKCKLFFKQGDGGFKERGIGTIFIKPVNDGAKHQLIVRADTSLGNIMANFILMSGLPAQRMGKNNVMVVCIPNTDFDKPVSILFRVKTAEEADDLLQKIKKYSAEWKIACCFMYVTGRNKKTCF